MKNVLFSVLAFAAGIFSIDATEGFLRGAVVNRDLEQVDNISDFCDTFDNDIHSCRGNALCTWCESTGVVTVEPTCVTVFEADWIPRQVYTCESKSYPREVDLPLDVAANDVEHALINHPDWTEFLNFIERFNKRYDENNFMHRFNIFVENLHKIRNHDFEFELGVNQFADMTETEFKEFISSGYGLEQRNALRASKVACGTFAPGTSTPPASIDWRTLGAVTPVKDQGQCGSCWSFSATGAMEGAWKIAKGPLVSLSEQQLIDCSVTYGNLACNGGFMDNAFSYAIDHGMCTEAADPYLAKKTTCTACTPVSFFTGCLDVVPNNQVNLKQAVARGPVSVAIEADTTVFQFYQSGVITSAKCGTNLDHGVLVVAYGTDNGQAYWTIKNSWGSSWGEKGYVRVAANFGSTNDPGICGVAMQPSFPVV